MNSPDHTYRKLTQLPFDALERGVQEIIKQFYQDRSISASECISGINDFRIQNGWSEDEYIEEYRKRNNGK